MISHRIDIAIQEAIQAHAAQHHHGKLDLEKIMSGLGEVAASFLAELPDKAERELMFSRFAVGVAFAAAGKATDRGAQAAPPS